MPMFPTRTSSHPGGLIRRNNGGRWLQTNLIGSGGFFWGGFTNTAEQWWALAADKSYWLGGFIWTGFDYRGEPTPYSWPNISSHFGVLDMCGFPKNIYYYYKSW